MDAASLIFGMSIASVFWLGFYPWSAMARLKELEAGVDRTSGAE